MPDLAGALAIVKSITGHESIFGSRDRIAMPDETLLFNTGNDRDRALLLYTLLAHSPIHDMNDAIGFSDDGSFVRHRGIWIDASDLSSLGSATPPDARTVIALP